MPRKRDQNKPPIRRNRRWSPDQNAWFVKRWAIASKLRPQAMQQLSRKYKLKSSKQSDRPSCM